MTLTPQIWVADLAAYNSGILHGRWIDATQDPDDIWTEIHAMLKASPEPLAEEWAVFDYEDLPTDLGECPDLELVSVIAQALEEHGEPFRAYLSAFGEYSEDAVEQFQERYVGEFDDRAHFAAELMESTGELGEMPERLQFYFDFDSYGRDLLLSGDVVESGGYWFWGY